MDSFLGVNMKVKFKKVRANAQLPQYLTKGSVGVDLCACIPGMGKYLAPGQIMEISTGIAVELPETYELQIRSRSGLARRGVTVINSPGTIDSDYRGEIKVLLYNGSGQTFNLNPGDRIAQMVLARTLRIEWEEAEELSETERGEKGVGSSGIASTVERPSDGKA